MGRLHSSIILDELRVYAENYDSLSPEKRAKRFHDTISSLRRGGFCAATETCLDEKFVQAADYADRLITH